MVLVNQIQKKINAEKSLAKGQQLWLDNRIDHAVYQAKNAYAVFKSIGDQYGLANTTRLLGECDLSRKNLLGACHWFEESLELFQQLGNLEGVSCISACLGDAYRHLQDHKQAMQFYHHAIKAGMASKDHYICRAFEGIAEISFFSGDLKEAQKYLKKSLILRREGKKNGCGSCQARYWNVFLSLVTLYKHTDQNSKALELFDNEGVPEDLKSCEPHLKCLLFASLATITSGDESKKYSKDARKIAKDSGDQSLIDKCLKIIYSDKSDQTNE